MSTPIQYNEYVLKVIEGWDEGQTESDIRPILVARVAYYLYINDAELDENNKYVDYDDGQIYSMYDLLRVQEDTTDEEVLRMMVQG